MYVHHWTPAEIFEMDVDDFAFAVEQTREWQNRERAAMTAARRK